MAAGEKRGADRLKVIIFAIRMTNKRQVRYSQTSATKVLTHKPCAQFEAVRRGDSCSSTKVCLAARLPATRLWHPPDVCSTSHAERRRVAYARAPNEVRRFLTGEGWFADDEIISDAL